ncbi:MAG: FxsA family protein [Aliidiomarina sp.]|uniref:FxsA family protein n=1 Tax=Aliidiomarina sp. TaxID=1872439 RepID=UPI0025C725F0|nr:FxsA family protein [Aliidiomarina sp.]MCH8502535.1 FxsA family protein [Aliidiomarina sp.]
MFPLLLLLFIGMPIIEILVLIQVGQVIGGINTVLLLIVTAVIGASLVRSQGLQSWQRAQQKMAMGELPSIELASGILLFVAGLMFVTPGFVTDLFALVIVLPPVRVSLAKKMMQRMQVQMVHGQAFGFHQRQRPSQQDRQRGDGDVFEGEYVDPERDRLRRDDDDAKK